MLSVVAVKYYRARATLLPWDKNPHSWVRIFSSSSFFDWRVLRVCLWCFVHHEVFLWFCLFACWWIAFFRSSCPFPTSWWYKTCNTSFCYSNDLHICWCASVDHHSSPYYCALDVNPKSPRLFFSCTTWLSDLYSLLLQLTLVSFACFRLYDSCQYVRLLRFWELPSRWVYLRFSVLFWFWCCFKSSGAAMISVRPHV